MSSNQKSMAAAEVNQAFVNEQDMISYRDSLTGTQKTVRKDDQGGLITENMVGSVIAGAKGTIKLVGGTITISFDVLRGALETFRVQRTATTGAPGFVNVVIDVPGNPASEGVAAVQAQVTITSSSGTDTSDFDWLAFEKQL